MREVVKLVVELCGAIFEEFFNYKILKSLHTLLHTKEISL